MQDTQRGISAETLGSLDYTERQLGQLWEAAGKYLRDMRGIWDASGGMRYRIGGHKEGLDGIWCRLGGTWDTSGRRLGCILGGMW